MARTGSSPPVVVDVVVCPDGALRRTLSMAVSAGGYDVSEVPTYAAVLCHLRTASHPMVVVAANVALDFQAEITFFGQVAADAALRRRHRFVLVSTNADWLPDELGATLHRLGVPVLRLPARLDDLLAAVAQAARPAPRARRVAAKDTPAG